MISANTPTPTSQASRPPRCVRSASAVGEASRRRRGGALSRAASRPRPMSRRRSIRAATSSRASVASAGRTSTAGRAPVNGRSSSAQPSGVSQRSQPADDVSATIRSSSASASAAPPSPERDAPRRRELAGDRADAGEHGQRRHEREREVGRRPDPGAADAGSRRAAPARRSRRPRRFPPARPRNAVAAAHRAGEHELPAAGVLLGAQRAHRPPAGPTAPAKIRSAPSRHAV